MKLRIIVLLLDTYHASNARNHSRRVCIRNEPRASLYHEASVKPIGRLHEREFGQSRTSCASTRVLAASLWVVKRSLAAGLALAFSMYDLTLSSGTDRSLKR